MQELVPTATIVALLVNPTNPIVAETEAKGMQAAARTLGLQLHVLRARSERDFDEVFSTLHQLGARALVIGGDPFFKTHSEQLAAMALGRAVPTIYQYREFAAAGGLMSYGSSLSELFRSTGIYVARILKARSRPTCRCSNPPRLN